jgi:excisionase family DNA binding protein
VAQQETTFVEVTVWGKQAEAGSVYLTKGRAVAIEGRLQQDTWATEAGERRSRLKVVAQRVTFLSSAPGQPAARRLLSLDEAARYLGLGSRWAVRRLVVNGALPVVRIAGKWRLDVEDLDKLIFTLKIGETNTGVRAAKVPDRAIRRLLLGT